ncbi:MAG TPA: CoA-binding protein [Candidatus Omnitrophica bacterium]|nr:CoA-binding protein [Candidatus Omnitrophota bacterium]
MLEEFFNPRGVAVVGATDKSEKIGHQIFKKIIEAGYKGEVYPVNPHLKGKDLLGRRGFASVVDIPSQVDLTVIVIPSQFVLPIVDECGRKGVKALVVISAGFKELGKEGVSLERKLIDRCVMYGMRMIGPNCMGIIDTYSKLDASFAPVYPPRGNLAFFSQSGALGSAVLDRVYSEHIGISKFISLGNKADITETDVLQMLGEDETSRVIFGYLESIQDGRKFLELAKEVSKKKPIILLKAGRSEWGSRAASSHTGALAGKDEAFDVTFKQCGVKRVDTFEEGFSFVKGFLKQPPPSGRDVLIVTNAGGAGILATDMIEKTTLQMARIETGTKEKMIEVLPPEASLKNPVDILGDGKEHRYREVLKIVKEDSNVDALLILLTPQAAIEPFKIAQVIVEECENIGKTVFTSFMGYERIKEAVALLEERGIPNYSTPEEAVHVLEALKDYKEWQVREEGKVRTFSVDKKSASEVITNLKKSGYPTIGGYSALEIFRFYGIPVINNILLRSEEDLKEASKRIDPPYVMKIESPEIIHKSDVGGVKLNVGREELLSSFRDMMDKARKVSSNISGISLQPMVQGGRELLIGVWRDEVFGHMIRFGLGGKYVEVFKDTSSRVLPITEKQALKMIEETKFAYPLLRGFRDEEASDLSFVVEAILHLSHLVCQLPEIAEIEANPFVVFKEGGMVIDARLRLGA